MNRNRETEYMGAGERPQGKTIPVMDVAVLRLASKVPQLVYRKCGSFYSFTFHLDSTQTEQSVFAAVIK